MQQPSVELVQQLTKQLNEIVQQPVAQIQSSDNEPSIITQQPVAQIQSISETLHNGIHIDLSEVEVLFKQSAVTRTNWASHVNLAQQPFAPW